MRITVHIMTTYTHMHAHTHTLSSVQQMMYISYCIENYLSAIQSDRQEPNTIPPSVFSTVVWADASATHTHTYTHTQIHTPTHAYTLTHCLWHQIGWVLAWCIPPLPSPSVSICEWHHFPTNSNKRLSCWESLLDEGRGGGMFESSPRNPWYTVLGFVLERGKPATSFLLVASLKNISFVLFFDLFFLMHLLFLSSLWTNRCEQLMSQRTESQWWFWGHAGRPTVL